MTDTYPGSEGYIYRSIRKRGLVSVGTSHKSTKVYPQSFLYFGSFGRKNRGSTSNKRGLISQLGGENKVKQGVEVEVVDSNGNLTFVLCFFFGINWDLCE